MSILTKQQAELMFRETDTLLLNYSFDPLIGTDADKDMLQVLRFFHANEVYQLYLDDDYFKGIRANTFCIEAGWSEHEPAMKCGEGEPKLYIVTANHKGNRRMVMYVADEWGDN